MNNQRVEELIQEAVENNNLFLVDYSISTEGVIKVLVDSITGIQLSHCMAVSRHVEHNLDREEDDFALEVSSPGLDVVFTVLQQYIKNIGRKINVVLNSGEELEGKLTKVEDISIELEWKAREPKPIGKGKVTVTKTKVIDLADISQTKVVISF
jgi:ribosome maturation factor RimP